tara:strand:- start:342 stop:1724 length:1383 start_codon:yes stop_codon:yes gene_type:complete
MSRGFTILVALSYISLLCVGITIGLLLFSGVAKSEDKTTDNLTPDMSGFTASGGTSVGSGQGCQSGKYCTSGTQGGGGTYTSSFNVPLTEGEVRKGFTLNSGITINSHQSNSVLDSCTSVMQSGDCRDIFKLTITLSDSGTAVETFAHQEELNWTGLKDFSFTDTVAENTYGVLTGVFSLYGIDAGYPSGYYGPQFSDPSLVIDYQTVLIQQQIETEIQNQIEQAAQTEVVQVAEVAVPVTTTETSSSPPPSPPSAATAPDTATASSDATPTAEPAAETAPPPPPAAPTAPTAPAAPTVQSQSSSSDTEETTEAEVEAEIEAEVEASSETESDSSSETTETAENTSTSTQPKATVKVKAGKSSKTKVRISQAQAAETVVARIAPSQRYGASAQTVTMVAMGMMSQTRGIFKSAGISDAPVFFRKTSVPDGPNMVDYMQNYVVFGTSNGIMESLIESQWRK